MIALDPTASHLVITNNRLQALLTDRAEREMVLKQPSQQLPPVTVKTLLKLGMFQASSVGPIHEADQRLKLLTARRESCHHSRHAALATGVAAHFDCTIITAAPELQDFTDRRVKFTSTGVEIGGHVRPPPWSTKDINNADFDTPFMTPRPRSTPPTTRPPNPYRAPQTPGQRQPGTGKPLHTTNI
jgi:hypothetical protein